MEVVWSWFLLILGGLDTRVSLKKTSGWSGKGHSRWSKRGSVPNILQDFQDIPNLVGEFLGCMEIHHVTDSAQGAQILVLVNMENSPILEKVRLGMWQYPALLSCILESQAGWQGSHARRKKRQVRMCRRPSQGLLWSSIGREVTRPGLSWHGYFCRYIPPRIQACCCKLLDLMLFPIDANAKRPNPNKLFGRSMQKYYKLQVVLFPEASI